MPGDEVFPDDVNCGPFDGDDAVQQQEPCEHVTDANGRCTKCGRKFGKQVFNS